MIMQSNQLWSTRHCIGKAFLLVITLALYLACSKPTEGDNKEQSKIIPTTTTKGPGGPTRLSGKIRDFVRPDQPVPNTYIYILNQRDYSDTLLHAFVNSTDATFSIVDMPIDTVDLIFLNETFFSRKIASWPLKADVNSFYNPGSTGYFLDSTIFMISVADSFVAGKTPVGYEGSLGVRFKIGVPDSVSLQMVKEAGCDTIRVYHHHDPIFDPTHGDTYHLLCGGITKIYEKTNHFNRIQKVATANPIMSQVFH